MARPVIITCAVTGGGDTVGKHPAIPVTPEEIAAACIEAAKAGAAICHIHVREPGTGKPSMEMAYYRETVERIRASGTDFIINLTTGAGGRFVPGANDVRTAGPGSTLSSPARRTEHVMELKPEVCSLDIATMNFGDSVFMNTPPHLKEMAAFIKQSGAKPELEVFDTGHARLARRLVEDGHIEAPPMFQLCLGIPWGAPATPESMIHMKSMLPPGALWAAFGISSAQMPMVAQAVILGGHVRVGLEDNLYLDKGVFATNAQLVQRATEIIRAIGDRPATPNEAREILGLKTRH
jgi:uncharacterized protein (DUF849 family)